MRPFVSTDWRLELASVGASGGEKDARKHDNVDAFKGTRRRLHRGALCALSSSFGSLVVYPLVHVLSRLYIALEPELTFNA